MKTQRWYIVDRNTRWLKINYPKFTALLVGFERDEFDAWMVLDTMDALGNEVLAIEEEAAEEISEE